MWATDLASSSQKHRQLPPQAITGEMGMSGG